MPPRTLGCVQFHLLDRRNTELLVRFSVNVLPLWFSVITRGADWPAAAELS